MSFISFRNERPKWRTPIWKNPWKIVPLQENQHKTWVFLLSPTRSTLCALRQLEANKRRIKLCNSSSTPSFSVLFFCMSLFIHLFFIYVCNFPISYLLWGCTTSRIDTRDCGGPYFSRHVPIEGHFHKALQKFQ